MAFRFKVIGIGGFHDKGGTFVKGDMIDSEERLDERHGADIFQFEGEVETDAEPEEDAEIETEEPETVGEDGVPVPPKAKIKKKSKKSS